MRISTSNLILAATDLSGFSECEHKTLLELAVVEGKLKRPGQNELERRLLEQRGAEHEKRVLEHYRAAGQKTITISHRPRSTASDLAEAARATEAAMEGGADVIHQGILFDGRWVGRPDFLVRRSRRSRFGEHSYEVVDAKLARHAKVSAVLQLCSYTDLAMRLQDCELDQFWLVPGRDEPKPVALRATDYMAFYRQMKGRLEAYTRKDGPAEPYPEPVEHCEVCPWWKRCEQRRREDDHLSLVAGITRRQRDRLALGGVRRVAELAAMSPTARVDGITDDALRRIREQATLQLQGRDTNEPVYQLVSEFEPGAGLERLPIPKPGDLFLDLEGDPFVRDQGLEYLFGLLELGEPLHGANARDTGGEPRYRALWATNPVEEKRAFEAAIDRITEGLEEFRDLHVFHFGHRESDALKRLSCRHHTREEQVDDLLRRHVLVDLHTVVRQAVRVSVEAYTLKELESLYRFSRNISPREAAQAMQLFGWWLETGEGVDSEGKLRSTIERYNEDDSRSTWQLREWLEMRRPELEQQLGRSLTRAPSADAGTSEKAKQTSEEVARVVGRLTEHLPDDPANDNEEQRSQRLLANLLDWHWREAKSGWWEYFRSLEVPRDERVEDGAVLGGLRFVADRGPLKKSRVHRYEFPEQEHRIHQGQSVLDPDTTKVAGEVIEIGDTHVDLKRNSKIPHPRGLMCGGPLQTSQQRDRLLEIGESVAEHGLQHFSDCALARNLLLRRVPECGQLDGAPLIAGQSDIVTALCELSLRLDGSVLAVQGPPGSGKTHCAAHIIARLVGAGKRVGVTANSHKVITSLIVRAVQVAKNLGLEFCAVHNPGSDRDGLRSLCYELERDHERNRARLLRDEIKVLGGTAWAWCRPEFRNSVDVLVVDEAGQVSLANVLALSVAAKNLMLFGDPAQLDQPQKGVHPLGANVSALEYLLGDALTLPDHAGVFLAETRRLHPAICDFTSAVFYEGRLKPIAGLERQSILGPGVFNGNGLRFVPVCHHGNSIRSDEEVDAIGSLLAELFRSQARFVDDSGTERKLTEKDVLVVAPYNAQVAALRGRLAEEIAVGTVDKFQGQEAPIVIYSMTSSSAGDAPRGMEFLYSLNRLNVATSRAQALVVLVASPELTRVRCKTPRQMRLVNALCAYVEHVR
ncbi:TM0106 family RecB-like putative nuclease [Myxococcota bacterium]